MPENPPQGFDDIHGSLTAPLLPSLEGSEVLAAPTQPAGPPPTPTNPTLPTLSWDSATSSIGETTPAPVPAPPVPPPPGAVQPPAPPVVDPAAPATTVGEAHGSPVPAPPVDGPLAPPAAVPGPPVDTAPAAAVTTAQPVVAAAPALPHVAPTPPPPATDAGHAFDYDLDAPPADQPSGHRSKDAVGAIVRTVLVAVLVAAAVFAGRTAWQWNEERQAGPTASDVLPSTPVAAIDARYVEFRLVGGEVITAHVDLSTGDYLADIAGSTQVARRGGAYWTRDAGVEVWAVASPEFLETRSEALEAVEQASVVMVTDVFPVEAHAFLAVTADEIVTVPGRSLIGPSVIEVTAPPAAGDGPSDGRIVTAGNSDPQLEDVVDNIANEGIESESAAEAPSGPRVVARQLTLTVDRLGLRAADPYLAESAELSGATPVDVQIWLDQTGAVRRLSAPEGVTKFATGYELLSASVDGAGPLAGLELPASEPPATGEPVPGEEVAG